MKSKFTCFQKAYTDDRSLSLAYGFYGRENVDNCERLIIIIITLKTINLSSQRKILWLFAHCFLVVLQLMKSFPDPDLLFN